MIGEPCSFHLYNNLKFEISDISHILNRGDSYIVFNVKSIFLDKLSNLEVCQFPLWIMGNYIGTFSDLLSLTLYYLLYRNCSGETLFKIF